MRKRLEILSLLNWLETFSSFWLLVRGVH